MDREIITTGKLGSIAEDLFMELFCDRFGEMIVGVTKRAERCCIPVTSTIGSMEEGVLEVHYLGIDLINKYITVEKGVKD